MRALTIALGLTCLLSACAEPTWAPDEAVTRAAYQSPDGPSITLFTVVRKLGNEGAHASIMINGSQRVIYDPAGNFTDPAVPERNDLLFGITPQMEQRYIDFHARDTFYMISQTVAVSPEVAEMAIQRAQANGASGKALCGTNVSAVLRDIPGFEEVSRTYFPGKIMREFEKLPGVVTYRYEDTDPSSVGALTVTPVYDLKAEMKLQPPS